MIQMKIKAAMVMVSEEVKDAIILFLPLLFGDWKQNSLDETSKVLRMVNL